jgi:3-hydroxyisobutyrate dehydrogenase-like beta-hydroxyacid dehydrogenase
MGKNIIRMGENGKGLTMKLCHNMCAAIISEAVSEMIVLGLKNGLQFDDILKAVSYGGAQNFYLDSKAARLKAGDFSVQFPLEHMAKDLGLVMELAESSGVSLPAGSAVKQIYSAAAARGMKREDFSAVLKVVKMLAGME